MEFINKYRYLIKLIISIFLFIFSSYFMLIPITLFKIDLKTCSPITSYALTLFANSTLSICLFLLYRKSIISDFKIFKKKFREYIPVSIKYWLIGIFIMAISNIIIGMFSPVKEAVNQSNIDEMARIAPIITIIYTTIIAPFNEEIIFRESFGKAIHHKEIFIITSGVIFGSLHVVLSVTSLYDYLYLIPYISLGIAFSSIYAKTDNIFSSIFIHMLHNIISITCTIIGMGLIIL